MCRWETGGTGILGVGGEECVLTELNQLTSTGRVVDFVGCRRSLSLGWVVDFGSPNIGDVETDILWNSVVLEDLDVVSDMSGMPCVDGCDELSCLLHNG